MHYAEDAIKETHRQAGKDTGLLAIDWNSHYSLVVCCM
jgi:hypothetical protein